MPWNYLLAGVFVSQPATEVHPEPSSGSLRRLFGRLPHTKTGPDVLFYLALLVLLMFGVGGNLLLADANDLTGSRSFQSTQPVHEPHSFAPFSTPLPTYTPSVTSTPYPLCGPGSDYTVAQSSNAQIVPGQTDIGNHCDDCITSLTLPFTFELYGVPFSSVNVSSNGQLLFENTLTDATNVCLPYAGFSNAILAHWDDLRTDTADSGVFTSVTGSAPNRILNIEWRATYYSGGGAANFEARLYEGQDRFDLVYGQVDGSGISATVGVQRETGSQITQYSCNTSSLFSGLQLSFTPAVCHSPTPTITGTPPTATRTATPCVSCPTATPTSCSGAWHYIDPQMGSPASGGTIAVGQKVTLDLRVNAGPHTDLTAQQAYLTFSYGLLQNVDATQSDCVVTDTVTPDLVPFNYVLQNEVCNGPAPCNFSVGGSTDPGSVALESGLVSRPPVGGDFRVARIAFCAVAPGQATLHWQFSPPAPSNRDTEIMDYNSNIVNVPSCYTDYVINIIATPTATPAITPTSGPLLVGHVTWQGPPPQPSQPQQLPLKVSLEMGSTQVNLPSATTDASGYITSSVAGLAHGSYTWWAKGMRYLANEGSVILAGEPVTNVEMGLMRAGDADSDNRVGLSDFVILRQSYGGSTDLRADFDNDGVVDVADFTLLRGNFGVQGAAPPGP